MDICNDVHNNESGCQRLNAALREAMFYYWEYIQMGKLIPYLINTLRLKENRCHVADNTSKCIFLYEKLYVFN